MPIQNRGVQKASLKLKFIPYLAIRGKIFSLTNAELDDYISELFETNPFVEETSITSLDEMFLSNFEAPEEDLYSFLEHEINMLELDETECSIAISIAENLNSEGYLKTPLDEIAKKLKVPKGRVDKVLKIVQGLEPAGIAARNLSECFVLQLEREEALSPKVKHIVLNHLESIVNDKANKISKDFGLSVEYLEKLREKLSSLNPTPGLMLTDSKEILKIPDIIVDSEGDSFTPRLNKMRDFVVNENYRKIIANIKDKVTKEQFEALSEKAVLASRAIRERERILLSLGEKLTQLNKDYLSFTKKFPEKIVLDDIAKDLKVSGSALSRIVQNKFIKIPCGIFPLRFFVKHKAMDYNDEDLKLRIKEIISTEDKANPLSDAQIEEILKRDCINIKRRTVAKYRNLLKIPPVRKRHFEK